jgi:two-component system, LuxR family, response regulator FixJ
MLRRIEPDQCGWPALRPFFAEMDEQASRIGLDSAMTQGAQPMLKRPVVTVVDDDPAVCGSLKFAIELEGFVVRTYHSGAELLEAGGLEDCNCFVIDQRMPGMTGMELVDVLRKRRILTPVILIISHPSAALSARAQKAAILVVEKPLLGNALVERIREACLV